MLEGDTARKESNLAAVRQWDDAYNAKDFERLTGLLMEGFRMFDPDIDTDIVGKDAFGEIIPRLAEEFPDRLITIQQLVPLGRRAVAMEAEWEATAIVDGRFAHAGEVRTLSECMVVELTDGLISFMRVYR